ncbi:hypothetical protein WJX73_008186 [Symbiochloris irregularis]|uniref:Uncharacterized protein n=1 Tax=Symbiochloris irregularis TaxID=706552 RepID=A0AAW1NT01_9CHLO
MAARNVNPHDTAPNEAAVLSKGGDPVASSGYKVPASEVEGPKNVATTNEKLAQEDLDLGPAREVFSKAKAEGDKDFKSTVAKEHQQAQSGGAADSGLKAEADKLKADLAAKHPETGTNRSVD